jgi:hypothetical protein
MNGDAIISRPTILSIVISVFTAEKWLCEIVVLKEPLPRFIYSDSSLVSGAAANV